MKPQSKLAVLASGALLWFVVVTLIGLAAAVPIPRAYLDVFGESRQLAMFLADAVLIVVPIFALCVAWAAATLWLARRVPRQALRWFLIGIAIAWVGIIAVSSVGFATMTEGESGAAAVLRFVLAMAVPVNVWRIPVYIAPWVGVGVGAWWMLRANSSLKRERSSSAA